MDFIQDQLKTYEELGSDQLKFKHLKLLSQNKVLLMIQQHPVLEKKIKSKNEILIGDEREVVEL
jgi:hypothetical protein